MFLESLSLSLNAFNILLGRTVILSVPNKDYAIYFLHQFIPNIFCTLISVQVNTLVYNPVSKQEEEQMMRDILKLYLYHPSHVHGQY